MDLRHFLGLIVCFAQTINTVDVQESDVIRKVSAGYLHGRKVETMHGAAGLVFLGIPYAEAPIGDNRYRPPIAKKTWDGILDVKQYRVSCLYNSSATDGLETNKYMSEDCLHLNVFTSTVCLNRSGCPVLFYIHGGGFKYGTPITIPEEEILDTWSRRDVVFVSTNFRLGSFGFYNTGNKSSAVKNVGILDQIEALKWVQNEIGKFGGDGHRITLIGLASGAVNVDQLAVSPRTDGLFQQAVLLSGAVNSVPLRRDTNYRASRELAKQAGCASKHNFIDEHMEKVLDCLRQVDAAFLLSYQREIEDSKFMLGFHGPMLDDDSDVPIFDEPVWSLNRDRRSQPMIVGTGVGDLKLMRDMLKKAGDNKKPKKSMTKVACAMALQYRSVNATHSIIKACSKEYGKDKSQDLLADVAVFIPAYESAYANAENGGDTYLFDIFESPSIIRLPPVKPHTTEKDIYAAYVANFAKYGKPDNNSIWLPFNVEDGNYLRVAGDFDHTGMAAGYHKNAIDFWEHEIFLINETMQEHIKNKTRPGKHSSEDEDDDDDEKDDEDDTEEFNLSDEFKKLIAEAKELNERYKNETREAKREFKDGLSDLGDRLEQAMKKWQKQSVATCKFGYPSYFRVEEEAQAAWNRSFEHHATKPAPLPITTPHSLHRRPPWLRPPKHGDKGKDGKKHRRGRGGRDFPWVQISGEENDDSVRIGIDLPPYALEHMDEIEDLIDRILDEINNLSLSHSHSHDDLSPMVRTHLVRNMLPVIVPPGNITESTVPTLTIEKQLAWGMWSWILLVLSIALAVALVITCVLFVQNRNKRLHYERIA